MAYELHIVRRREDGAESISRSEWSAVVETDPELTAVDRASVTSPTGETLSLDDDSLAQWTGHPGSAVIWLRHVGGRISVGVRDEPTIFKLIALADRLGACVEGDDGEIYGGPAQG